MKTNKDRIWISKNNKSKMVIKENLDIFLQEGWIKGHLTDTQKLQHKKWYNNGTNNLIIKNDEKVPDGYVPGMLKRPGTYSTYKYHWYTNGVNSIKIKEGCKIPIGYYKGQSTLHKFKNSKQNKNTRKLKNKQYSDLYKNLYYNKNLSIEYLKENNSTLLQLADKFNCTIASLQSWIKKFNLYEYINIQHGKSAGELDLFNYLCNTYPNIKFYQHNRTILNGKEIDIFIPDKNIGIEYNGLYWHSAQCNVPKNYHQDKVLNCNKLNISLIHIYEDVWNNLSKQIKLKAFLQKLLDKTNNIINIDDCNINIISKDIAKKFISENSLYKFINSTIYYGVFYQNNLIEVISFLKVSNQWLITDIVEKLDYTIIDDKLKIILNFLNTKNINNLNIQYRLDKFNYNNIPKSFKYIKYTEPIKYINHLYTNVYDSGFIIYNFKKEL